MGGGDKRDDNVIIPDLGAAKYWYVDPRAKGVDKPETNVAFNPMEFWDEQGHTPQQKKKRRDNEDFLKALEALGANAAVSGQMLPEGTKPQF